MRGSVRVRKVVSVAISLAAGVLLPSCEDGTAPSAIAKIELAASSTTLFVGQTVQLTATAKDAAGNPLGGRAVTWSSSDRMVAEVSPKGLVTATGPGSATLTARAEDRSGSLDIAVVVQRTVTAGGSHTCSVGPNGAAFCWGSNGAGQLGSAAATESCRGEPCSARPIAVSGGLTFVSVSAGTGHTCGVTPAGAAYCWGDNRHGKLGNGSTTSSTAPVPVAGGLAFASVAAGWDHTCGITREGQAYCWGTNRFGELGSRTATEQCPDLWENPVPCSTRPIRVSGDLTFTSLDPARLHTCGLSPTGAAYCWGKNEAGLLGTTAATESCGGVDRDFACSFTPVAVSGGLTFAALSGGDTHTCGVARDGQAHCWGVNVWGVLGRSLGHDGPLSTAAPGPVSGGLTFASLSAGSQHSCGIAAGGETHCWGFGFGGALGNGSRAVGGPEPVRVVGGLTFASISAGGSHTCGINTVGAIYCWGVNSSGQLGNTAAAETCATDRGGAAHPCSSTPQPVSPVAAATSETPRVGGAASIGRVRPAGI